jgi:release factor glutamine methyltransferase
MTTRLALDDASRLLASAGLDPEEASALAEVAADAAQLVDFARSRAAGTPLAHLTGKQRFLGLELLTAPDVLIPRAETELLARTSVELLRSCAAVGGEMRFLDLCCGAGNLACAIAANLPDARGWATDLTSAAVALARRNVLRLGVGDRVEVLKGDLFEPLADLGLQASLDAVVCNPPYISTGRLGRDRAALLAHEPREAFDGGPYGLSIHQRVAREAAAYLRPGAPAMLEVGEGQERQVLMLFRRTGLWNEPEVRLDDMGTPRVVVARRR